MANRKQRDERFREVLAEHGRGLWRLTAGYARGLADREDLYQDILVALLGALPSFRGNSAMRTFVYRIGHNQGISHRRRQTRTPQQVSLDGLPSSFPSPEADTIASGRRRQLQAAIRQLPHGRRQVIMLSLEGLDHGEIGEVLGLTSNNVAVRLHRARADLRRHLEPSGQGNND